MSAESIRSRQIKRAARESGPSSWRHANVEIGHARIKAKRILAERTLGRQQTSSVGWQTAVEKFLEARRSAGAKDRTVEEYERTLKRYFTFGTTPLTEIIKRDISGKLEKLNRVPPRKAHALVVIKMFFRWALQDGYLEIDPTASFKRTKQKKRKRVLSDAELKAVLVPLRSRSRAVSINSPISMTVRYSRCRRLL